MNALEAEADEWGMSNGSCDGAEDDEGRKEANDVARGGVAERELTIFGADGRDRFVEAPAPLALPNAASLPT